METRPKNPHAVAMGKLGGKTTGPTKARDPEKMRQAALKRWASKPKPGLLGLSASNAMPKRLRLINVQKIIPLNIIKTVSDIPKASSGRPPLTKPNGKLF